MFYSDGTPTNLLTNHKRHGSQVYTVYTLCLYVPNYMFYSDGTPTNLLTNHKRHGSQVYTVYTLYTVYTVLIIAFLFYDEDTPTNS